VWIIVLNPMFFKKAIDTIFVLGLIIKLVDKIEVRVDNCAIA